jgi:hypothetical protein
MKLRQWVERELARETEALGSVAVSTSRKRRDVGKKCFWGAPRRPRYTFLAPSVSTLSEPIINMNSNFKTKNILECLSTVKYFHIIIIIIIIIISSSSSSTY